MKRVHPLRLLIASLVGILLAACLAIQSLGIALTQKAPDMAVAMFPLNGLAEERMATLLYLSSLDDAEVGEIDGRDARDWALASYRDEPLTPSSHMVLAATSSDPDIRSRIVNIAVELNRRESKLQGLLLQDQVAAQDYPGAVRTLDRILRVRPSSAGELFPSLLAVFAQEGAVGEFARILDGSSPWHKTFVEYAVLRPPALPNLLKLRSRISFDDEDLDRRLLENLASSGDLEGSYGLYAQIGREDEVGLPNDSLDWKSRFPPFDWKFADDGDLRAQVSLSGDSLEIRARPGNGGVVASRVIKAPSSPFTVMVRSEVTPAPLARDVRISLRCSNEESPLLDVNLDQLGSGRQVDAPPASCEFLEVDVSARSWSGRPALNAEIAAIQIRE